MSWFSPAELPDNKYFLFGQGGGEKLAKMAQSTLLAQIPIVQSVREAGDNGTPAAAQDGHVLNTTFDSLVKNTVQQVNLRHELYEPTRIVKMQN